MWLEPYIVHQWWMEEAGLLSGDYAWHGHIWAACSASTFEKDIGCRAHIEGEEAEKEDIDAQESTRGARKEDC